MKPESKVPWALVISTFINKSGEMAMYPTVKAPNCVKPKYFCKEVMPDQ